MLKRSKPNRQVISVESQPDDWARTKDFIVTFGAMSGILAGVLWMGGRFYAYGYFERMNIPIYFLSFSAGEYAETYITSITGNILSYIFAHTLAILVAVIIVLVIALILWVVQKFYKNLKLLEAVEKINNINHRFLAISFFILFLFSFIAAYNNGGVAAYYAMTHARPTTVYSRDLLPLGVPSLVSTSDNKSLLYEFTGLYLLTFNNGKYYLFRELDLTTCKPKQVYIVPDSASISINIQSESLAFPNCSVSPNP